MINVQHYVCLPQCQGEGYQSLVTHGKKMLMIPASLPVNNSLNDAFAYLKSMARVS